MFIVGTQRTSYQDAFNEHHSVSLKYTRKLFIFSLFVLMLYIRNNISVMSGLISVEMNLYKF